MDELVSALVLQADFFAIPPEPPAMHCATDGPDDYVYLHWGDRTHRVSVYGLLDWTRLRDFCPNTPAPSRELQELAATLNSLQQPPAEPELAFPIDTGTLVAAERENDDRELEDWTVPGARLADLEDHGWYRSGPVTGNTAEEAFRAIAAQRTYSPTGYFEEDGRHWLVGLRVEFPGWDAYH
jgi:hypothetical protein